MTDNTTQPEVTQADEDSSWFLIATDGKKNTVILDYAPWWKQFDVEFYWEDTFQSDPPSDLAPGAYLWTGFTLGFWDEDSGINATGGTFEPHRLSQPPTASTSDVREAEHLRHIIDRDRYIVAQGLGEIRRALESHRWLLEGRGPYEWDDDRYRDEFTDWAQNIERATGLLAKLAWDKSDCTTNTDKVLAAKEAAREFAVEVKPGHRDMLPSDLGLPCPSCNAALSAQPAPVMVEAAWRDGWAECKASLTDDQAFCLTEDVEQDAWSDSTTRRSLLSRASNDVAPADAWIVLSGDGKRFRTWANGFSAWTDDRDKATRYARREDAEAVHAEDEDAWSIVPFAPADGGEGA